MSSAFFRKAKISLGMFESVSQRLKPHNAWYLGTVEAVPATFSKPVQLYKPTAGVNLAARLLLLTPGLGAYAAAVRTIAAEFFTPGVPGVCVVAGWRHLGGRGRRHILTVPDHCSRPRNWLEAQQRVRRPPCVAGLRISSRGAPLSKSPSRARLYAVPFKQVGKHIAWCAGAETCRKPARRRPALPPSCRCWRRPGAECAARLELSA